MKIISKAVAISFGLGLAISIVYLPNANTGSAVVTSKNSDGEVLAAHAIDNIDGISLPSTTTSGEHTSMNRITENTYSARPFDAAEFVKPTDQDLRHSLSNLAYKVTQKDGTEPPFSSALHNEKRVGLYVDVVSGEPLFSSSDKFDSGTGWPSFSRPIAAGAVIEKEDRSLFGIRTEIRSSIADSHLGHVFDDGPAPTGLRYCMNAAAMRFIPIEKMVESGYGDYVNDVSTSQHG